MELGNVESWGNELIAPDTPRYDLMKDVRVGDVVLHWVGKNNSAGLKPGMYGASIVAGELRRRAGNWLGHPANIVPLVERTALPRPYLLTELRADHQVEILKVKKELENRISHRQLPIYFPFHKHPTNGLKPNQGYLFKLPAEVLHLAPGLLPNVDWSGSGQSLSRPSVADRSGTRERYAGFCADPVLKKAIEVQAVQQVIAHYESVGFSVEDVGAYRSYDLEAVRGSEIRHVEVKGSQSHVGKIFLTRNEVSHANTYGNTDLVVVEEIQWQRQSDGAIVTRIGTLTVYPNWRPSPDNLKPLSYEYVLD